MTRHPIAVLAGLAVAALVLTGGSATRHAAIRAETQSPTMERGWLLAQPIGIDLGGSGSRPLRDDRAFSLPIANLDAGYRQDFAFGNQLFDTNWVPAPESETSFEGLGPVFNRDSCSGCHLLDGRGRPPASEGAPMLSMLMRLSLPGTTETGGPVPHPDYGDQLNDRAIPGVPAEGRAIISYTEIARPL